MWRAGAPAALGGQPASLPRRRTSKLLALACLPAPAAVPAYPAPACSSLALPLPLGPRLQYLANVLGWSIGGETPAVRKLPSERVSPEEQERAEGLLARDYALYDVLQQRVADQAAHVAAENAQQ